jgi:Fe-S cluster assembly iron-binding protein IscA
MALDEPKENDEVFEVDGFQYLVNKDFLQRAQPIKIDFLVHGFKLDCGLEFSAGCSSCGTGSCG